MNLSLSTYPALPDRSINPPYCPVKFTSNNAPWHSEQPSPGGDRKRSLIVDDVGLFIQLQIARLGQSRFEIHEARTGTEALEKARSVSPDLTLLDLHMPDVNGENVCRLLKEDFRTRSIPVIIVSSGTSDHKNSDCFSAGCDGLIHKPIRRDLLLSMVGQRLGISIRRWRRTSVDLPCRVILDGQEIHTHPLPLRRRGL